MKGDTSRLGFNTSKKGESSGTKSNFFEEKNAPNANKPTSKKVLNMLALSVINLDLLQMCVETKPMEI